MSGHGVVRQFSFQFHATPDEIAALAHRWAEELHLHLFEEMFGPPYVVRAAQPLGASNCLPNRFTLLVDRPDLGDLESARLHDGEGFNFLLPRLTDEGLTEASVGGGTTDPDRLRRWKNAVRRLQRDSHAGARVVSPSGAVGEMPAHRHTAGAHRVAVAGTPIIAFPGGTNRYEFYDV